MHIISSSHLESHTHRTLSFQLDYPTYKNKIHKCKIISSTVFYKLFSWMIIYMRDSNAIHQSQSPITTTAYTHRSKKVFIDGSWKFKRNWFWHYPPAKSVHPESINTQWAKMPIIPASENINQINSQQGFRLKVGHGCSLNPNGNHFVELLVTIQTEVQKCELQAWNWWPIEIICGVTWHRVVNLER